MVSRRGFLSGIAAGLTVRGICSQTPGAGVIQTVSGVVRPEDLGTTLMHEHVLVDFIGAANANPGRYDADEVFRIALPHLKRLVEAGCQTLVECTPAYIGRDPRLLRRLSEAAGIRIVTNTGYYAAGQDYKFLPRHAHSESAEQLASRWAREAREGIAATGIRPGIIKIGVTRGDLPQLDRKIVTAAALTHRETGLAIASHTGDGKAALIQLDILEKQGVAPEAFIWVHAQNESDPALHVMAARRGAWVEFDGIGEKSLQRDMGLVRNLAEAGFLGRTLLSQDAGWYHVGEPGGGQYRGYEYLLAGFIPALEKSGMARTDIRKLLEDNPRSALTIGFRRQSR
jgi:phosphotriesterase-related protein